MGSADVPHTPRHTHTRKVTGRVRQRVLSVPRRLPAVLQGGRLVHLSPGGVREGGAGQGPGGAERCGECGDQVDSLLLTDLLLLKQYCSFIP